MDWSLMRELERIAVERYGGHFTVLRFTTNWRVAFTTVRTDMMDGGVSGMCVGKTFVEAARGALDFEAANPGGWYDRIDQAEQETEEENMRAMMGQR